MNLKVVKSPIEARPRAELPIHGFKEGGILDTSKMSEIIRMQARHIALLEKKLCDSKNKENQLENDLFHAIHLLEKLNTPRSTLASI